MVQQTLRPVVFVICDGLGFSPKQHGNAVLHANMTTLTRLMQTYPSAYLAAAGSAVGLPAGFIGNSQVGHLTLGAGRVVESALVQFDNLIDTQKLDQHEAATMLRTFASSGKTLHLMGLLSNGGVHSCERHLHAMLALAARCGVKNIIVHPILDGRDVAPKSATTFLGRLEQQLQAVGVGVIGSLQGRFYAMDRDQNLDRTAAAYEMLCGQRLVATGSWAAYLDQSYQTGNSDEFVVPTLLDKRFALCDGDAMVFVNVRPDRAKQLTTCLLGQTPAGSLKKLAWVLTGYQYDAALHNPVIIKPINVSDTFLDVVAAARPAWPHFLIAETEKYAHVTYFFKGMRDEHPSYETRILIPSLKVRDYVGHPAMSAFAITQQVINTLTHHPGALCIVNYANADMVGHSGNLAAATAACSIVDKQLAQLYDLVVQRLHGTLIVTADHGNAEAMLDVHDQIVTAHTTNPVPFVIAQQSLHHAAIPHNQSAGRGIAHVAPTVLKHLGIAVPTVMTEPLF